jgi:hypothetical protein
LFYKCCPCAKGTGFKTASKLVLESVGDGGKDPSICPEPVFLNVYGAQESIPRNEFSQPM